MIDRHTKRLALSFACGGLLSVSVQAALFPSQSLFDHMLCCGTTAKSASAGSHVAGEFALRSGFPLLAVAASTRSGGGAADTSALSTPAAAASGSTIAAKTAEPAKMELEDGYLKLGFDRLSAFAFKVPPFDPAANPDVKPPTGEEQIPGWLKDLNGKKAMVTGFMLPIKMDGNLVTEFLLLSDPMMCCYGAVPEMNQWIVVKMKKGGVRPVQDIPISFYGDLKVGAMFENGYMTGIYSMDCDKMGAVQG